MKDNLKIYCKFNPYAEPLTSVMCKSYTDFLSKFKKIEKKDEEPRHNNIKHDKI